MSKGWWEGEGCLVNILAYPYRLSPLLPRQAGCPGLMGMTEAFKAINQLVRFRPLAATSCVYILQSMNEFVLPIIFSEWLGHYTLARLETGAIYWRVRVEYYVNENTFKERLQLYFIKNQRSSEYTVCITSHTAAWEYNAS
uniref:Uncharacterized protein n=1 Tax=Timema genevievae TaxID=629358 RepID=A0A7R9JTI2_TIMGE|nr:unnamed protein product [Timema genevievae]